jgi:His-Xaa-Ser system protein HxsD
MSVQMPQSIEEKEGKSLIKLNPSIYPLDAVYSAAYVFLDRAYILLDGDPKSEIRVIIRSKSGKSENLAMEFTNELIKCCEYKVNSERNKDLRRIILERAIVTAESSGQAPTPIEEDDFLDDPEDIAIPWEQKYGKEAK